MTKGSTKARCKCQVYLECKKCNATWPHLSSGKKHSTELNCATKQTTEFTSMKMAQSGPTSLLLFLLLPFCTEASDSVFPAGTPASHGQSLRLHPVGPQQRRAHPWWKRQQGFTYQVCISTNRYLDLWQRWKIKRELGKDSKPGSEHYVP